MLISVSLKLSLIWPEASSSLMWGKVEVLELETESTGGRCSSFSFYGFLGLKRLAEKKETGKDYRKAWFLLLSFRGRSFYVLMLFWRTMLLFFLGEESSVFSSRASITKSSCSLYLSSLTYTPPYFFKFCISDFKF